MTHTTAVKDMQQDVTQLQAGFENACRLIAPNWPLDQMIAVNPFWEMRHTTYADAAALVAAAGRARTLMPPTYYATESHPQVSDLHLKRAAKALNYEGDIQSLRPFEVGRTELPHWQCVSDILDLVRDQHQMQWREEITQQISQFCALYFQSADAAAAASADDLYQRWLANAGADLGIPIVMGEPTIRSQIQALPADPDALLMAAMTEMELTPVSAEMYAYALLMSINGWASWVAYLRWQSQLAGGEQDSMKQLLAIRMAWDLVLWRIARGKDRGDWYRLNGAWQQQLAGTDSLISSHRNHQRTALLWQYATELAYQEGLFKSLLDARPTADRADAPELQAVFCIDVRSEVFRRHLEAQDPGIQTIGFAGFFGLPIAFELAGTAYARPQLPGLLSPGLRLVAEADPRGKSKVGHATRLSRLGDSPLSMFSMVEAAGPWFALKLIRDSLGVGGSGHPAHGATHHGRMTLYRGDTPLTDAESADLAAGILRAMGLTQGFARTVLLTGHGSSTVNNPHAAALDCGACGGQTGELNARALASLLNDPTIRSLLTARGIEIPDQTLFVAALHDTTTDDIRVFGDANLPAGVRQWLEAAGNATRRERATRLGEQARSDQDLAVAIRRRSRDWSEVRPEWGLAGNAAFIAAPRSRTRHIDLGGRVFLHDYRWQDDNGFGVLTLIMTAPMIVANWINMQYNASVVDNFKFGSGNKVLHNVVGGRIGVFEGQGGDLRIGLPLQSVHDGQRWMHTPQRLTVVLQAPREPMLDIYQQHDAVRQLVDNEWLFLFRLDDAGESVERLHQGEWHPGWFGQ